METKQNLVEVYNLINSVHISGDDIDRIFYAKRKLLEELGYTEKSADENGDKNHS